MSYIIAPDVHPGRCLNHRTDPTDPYQGRSLRCLRSEGHTEACRFPEPQPQVSSEWNAYVARNPQRWVEQ